MYSSKSKEHVTSPLPHPRAVAGKHINRIVADNLAYWMREEKVTQAALAQRAGISQKTVSNYLNPDQRSEGTMGKPPSPKLTELALIADALHVQVWQMLREGSVDASDEAGWPFSQDLKRALAALDSEALRRIEGVLRALLGMAAAPPRNEDEEKASGKSSSSGRGASKRAA